VSDDSYCQLAIWHGKPAGSFPTAGYLAVFQRRVLQCSVLLVVADFQDDESCLTAALLMNTINLTFCVLRHLSFNLNSVFLIPSFF
jgi:hypothetical protein